MANSITEPHDDDDHHETEWRDDAKLFVFGTICWIAMFGYFIGIGFNWLVGDPLNNYWEPSSWLLDVRSDPSLLFKVQHPDQVPAYTYLIALLRGLVGSHPSIMQGICYLAWIGNIIVVRHILRALDAPRGLALQGAALYGLFPFTGLTYDLFPLSDHPALFCVSAGYLAYLQRRPGLMAIGLAVAIMTHKFMWPVAGLIILIGLWQHRIPIWAAVTTFIPLLLYWFGVSAVNSDFQHLIAGNIGHGVAKERIYPIADGILGSLGGSVKDIAQGLVCLGIAVVSAALCFTRSTRREPALLAFAAPLVLFALITNEKLVWGLVRFGPLMVVPLFVWFADQPKLRTSKAFVVLIVGTIVLSLATQFAFASYVSAFFGAHAH